MPRGGGRQRAEQRRRRAGEQRDARLGDELADVGDADDAERASEATTSTASASTARVARRLAEGGGEGGRSVVDEDGGRPVGEARGAARLHEGQ